MANLAPLPIRMDDPPSADSSADPGRRYEGLLARALRYAQRFVQADQASDVAHEVAVEMAGRGEPEISGTLLYIAVVYRLRSRYRSSVRRAEVEGAYAEWRSRGTPAWAQPDANLEVTELRERIEETLARMPAGMREAFLLVREDDLSYGQAAARLGVAVGTVHTQMSRANALLRECVRQYHGDHPRGKAR